MAQLLGNFGEFFGSVAVVATLIYVATQVTQSARLIENQSHLDSVDQDTKSMSVVSDSSQLYALLVKEVEARTIIKVAGVGQEIPIHPFQLVTGRG